MLSRPRHAWLVLMLGFALSALPFLGSADAAPGASRARSHSSRSSARARTSGHRRPSTRSQARHDPPAPTDDDLSRDQILSTSASESIGRAAQGRLRNGVELGESGALDVLSNSEPTSFGTSELVAMLEHAATDVAQAFPNSRLHVGDLSKRGGGRLGSHRSHRSGRDADVGFYFVDESGTPVQARQFVRFDASGTGTPGWSPTPVRFDAARNWALLASMIRYQGANLQYVFVSPRLQPLLLEEAARQGASAELIARATDLMSHYAGGHDNHFHVRIHCPANDRDCVDSEPRRRRRSRHGRPSRPSRVEQP